MNPFIDSVVQDLLGTKYALKRIEALNSLPQVRADFLSRS
jgi:hypothetical protein